MFSLGVLQSVREMQNSTPVSQKELRTKGKKHQAQQIQFPLLLMESHCYQFLYVADIC